MPRRCITGYAIVSADGMIADSSGVQPAELKVEADQRFFHNALNRADVLVHGRHSFETEARADRPRIILTRRIAALAPDPSHPRRLLWNPAGASFAEAVDALGLDGTFAVIGGTEVFGLFLRIGYHRFHLSRVKDVRLPGGLPVFPQVPMVTPEQALAAHGLAPAAARALDPALGVTVVMWERQS
jgi:dihydrofolate reductase